MKRSRFVVLLLMAAIAAYGSGSVGLVDADAYYFVGPVCYPGDPCGPGGIQISRSPDRSIVDDFSGPMCFPSDPCGPGGIRVYSLAKESVVGNFSGPMCFPGDPCGSGLSLAYSLQGASAIGDFSGPMCFPGDPCGSGGTRQVSEVPGLHTRRDIKPLPGRR